MSAVFAVHASHAALREHDLEWPAPDGAMGLQLLARARASLLANDLAAFASTCHHWFAHAHGIGRGDGVLLRDAGRHVELRVDDVALGWDSDSRLEQPLLWLYGPTVQPDGLTVALQWNRVRHDAGLAKLARHSDALALLAPSPVESA